MDDLQDDDVVVNARNKIERALQSPDQDPESASSDHNPFESDIDGFAASGRSEKEAVNGSPPSLARIMGEWLTTFWT